MRISRFRQFVRSVKQDKRWIVQKLRSEFAISNAFANAFNLLLSLAKNKDRSQLKSDREAEDPNINLLVRYLSSNNQCDSEATF